MLLLATLFLSFSGCQDQLAYWAVTIGGSMIDKAPPPVLADDPAHSPGAPAIRPGRLLRCPVARYSCRCRDLRLLHSLLQSGARSASRCRRRKKVGQDTAKRVPADKRRYYLPTCSPTR